MTIATDVRTNANASTETRLARDVEKDIMHLGEPTDAPLMTLLGGYRYEDGGAKPKTVEGKIGKQKTVAVTFEVIEKDPLARALYLYTGGESSSATQLETADIDGVATTSLPNVTVGDLVFVKETKEIMLVISKDVSGAYITVRRGVAGTTAKALVGGSPASGGETMYIMSYACREAGSKRSVCSQLAAARTQTTQILKRTFGISKTMDAVETLTSPKDWEEEMTQAAYNLKLDAENAAWYAGGSSSTDANSNTVKFMKGVIPTIEGDTTRIIDCNAGLSEATFYQSVLPTVFQYGPKVKTLFADSKLVSVISSWPQSKLNMTVKETDFGFDIQNLICPFGRLQIVLCGAFANFLPVGELGYGVVLDLKNVIWRPLRDWYMETDIQTPGDDTREGQFVVEAGMMVKMIKYHSIIKNIG